MQVYDSFKNGGAEISMVPAVRDPKTRPCVDQHTPGCPWEKVTLCAFDGQPTATRVAYLDCMDTPWSHLLNWTDPKRCAEQLGIPYDGISKCFNGTRGEQLLNEAAATFTAQFPKPVFLPQAAVNGKVVDADYDSIKAAACKAGSSSSAC